MINQSLDKNPNECRKATNDKPTISKCTESIWTDEAVIIASDKMYEHLKILAKYIRNALIVKPGDM